MNPPDAAESPFVTFEEAERERIRRQLLWPVSARIAALEDLLELGLTLVRPHYRRGGRMDPHYRELLDAEAAGRWSLPPKPPAE